MIIYGHILLKLLTSSPFRKAVMKLIPGILLLFLLSYSSNARLRLYSRDLAEKHVADSLKAIDSLRVVDSLRVADSMMLARYQVADTVMKEGRIRKQKEIEAYLPVDIDSSERIIPDDVDITSAREIVIDQNNPYARTIDSLQNRTDSICNSIHDHDSWYKNMKKFPISEKVRYMIYLMQNNMKDTSEILTCCSQLYQMYSSRLDLLVAIRNSQADNNKVLITSHIGNLKQQLVKLSDFMVAISSKLPFHPQRQERPGLQ